MLLNEITTSDEAKIKKINKALKETYGFSLVSDIKTGKLNQLYTKIADDLYNLKLNQATAQDPAYMQKLLVLEGLKMIRDRKIVQLDEAAMLAGRGGRALERIVNKLATYVRKACDVGDSWETAIDDAMRAYEIQPYRFDRDLVEHELRKLTVHDCTDALIHNEVGMMESEELNELDKETYGSYMKKSAHDLDQQAKLAQAAMMADDDPDDANPMMRKMAKRSKGLGRAANSLLTHYGDDDDIKAHRGNLELMRAMGKKNAAFIDDEFDETVELDEDLSFFVEPQGQGATVMNSKGEVHDYYDSAEEARKVAGELNAKYGTVEEIAPVIGAVARGAAAVGKAVGGAVRGAGKAAATGAGMAVANKAMGGEELEEVNRDRYAEQDWVRGIRKDQAKAAGDDELELSLVGDDDDDGDDYFSHMAKRNKRNEMKEGYVKELRKLLEAETDQAESLIAAKSFSQELQDMIEKLGRLVNEDLPAVSDQMRDSHGADVATGFEDNVSGTLNGIMDNLRNSKQELDNSVEAIATGGMPAAGNDMDEFSDEELGGEEDFDAELDLDGDVELDLDDAELGDEFGGADELAGAEEEPLGRAKKESMKILAKKIVEAEQKLARLKSKQ